MSECATLSYCRSDESGAEQCCVRGAWFEGVECSHCLKKITHAGLVLTAPDGDVYHLHRLCALKGCSKCDHPIIYSSLRSIGAAPLGECVRVVKRGDVFISDGNQRHWQRKGEPEEDWYVEIDSRGEELAGD